MKFGLLVRDKIPQLIRKEGRTPVVHIASDEEYWEAIKAKLLEEIDEFYKTEEIEDFIDIIDVLDAITEFKNFNRQEIDNLRKKKASERGVFSKRIILDDFDKLWKYI